MLLPCCLKRKFSIVLCENNTRLWFSDIRNGNGFDSGGLQNADEHDLGSFEGLRLVSCEWDRSLRNLVLFFLLLTSIEKGDHLLVSLLRSLESFFLYWECLKLFFYFLFLPSLIFEKSWPLLPFAKIPLRLRCFWVDYRWTMSFCLHFMDPFVWRW